MMRRKFSKPSSPVYFSVLALLIIAGVVGIQLAVSGVLPEEIAWIPLPLVLAWSLCDPRFEYVGLSNGIWRRRR